MPGIHALRHTVERQAGRRIFGSRRWLADQIDEVASTLANARVLEIGSGRHDYGTDAYSRRRQFPSSCDFVKSDVNPEYGHEVVDVTAMEFELEFDAILCMSVLEHIPNFWEAIPRMRRALVAEGRLLLSVPMIFPYHDEPRDYYRFTTYGIRNLLQDFATLDIRYQGARRMPFNVFAIATK